MSMYHYCNACSTCAFCNQKCLAQKLQQRSTHCKKQYMSALPCTRAACHLELGMTPKLQQECAMMWYKKKWLSMSCLPWMSTPLHNHVNNLHWGTAVNHHGVHSSAHEFAMCFSVPMLVEHPKYVHAPVTSTPHRVNHKLCAISLLYN